MTTIEMLQATKALLSNIQGINSVAIGVEPNIHPNKYPMIRIVPVRSERSDRFIGAEKTQLDIYIATHQNKVDGLEANYAQLNAWETAVKSALEANTQPNTPLYTWQSTIHDEDRLPQVKALILSVVAEG